MINQQVKYDVQDSDKCVTAIEMITYWASSSVSKEETDRWLPVICEVAIYWAEASSNHSYVTLSNALKDLNRSKQQSLLSRLKERYGVEGARAAFVLMESLMASHVRQDLLPLLNEQLTQTDYKPIDRPRLSMESQLFGAALIDRIIGIKTSDPLKPARVSGTLGYLALPLIGAGLSERERICFSSLMIDALAALHDQRLEPTQGFSPERLIITHRFELIAPLSKPTQLTPLHSPEIQNGDERTYSADVWSLARLLLSILTSKPFSTPPKRLWDSLPPDIAAPLKRAIHLKPQERFYSGKELRVVLNTPLKKWITQLNYEAQTQETAQDDQQSLEEALLSYEDFTEQEEKQQEVKVKKRRAEEKQLRLKHQRKMKVKQALSLLITSLVFYGIYYGIQSRYDAQEALMLEAIKKAEATRASLDLADLTYQTSLPEGLAELGFKWRSFTLEQLSQSQSAVAPFLISVSEVTEGQYQSCVEANVCVARTSTRDCPIKTKRDPKLPVTCVTFEEASTFAKYVGGTLPERGHWSAIMATQKPMTYPWGVTSPSPQHANLRYSDHIAATKLAPVCSASLGDSKQGLCDLIGNVHEWLVINFSSTVIDGKEKLTPLKVGFSGGGWLSPANYKPNGVAIVPKTMRGEDLGFRVIKELIEP